MTSKNLTTSGWQPISAFRRQECKKVSDKFINYLINKGFIVDDYTKEFIDSIFQRILVGPKAYRVYDAFDVFSKWHNTAEDTIKSGTLHHMYLKDNNLKYGIVRDKWCNELLSTGITKEETIYYITEMICSKPFFLEFVEKMRIARHS